MVCKRIIYVDFYEKTSLKTITNVNKLLNMISDLLK